MADVVFPGSILVACLRDGSQSGTRKLPKHHGLNGKTIGKPPEIGGFSWDLMGFDGILWDLLSGWW